MKKALLVLVCASFLMSGCFISRIFQKKEKYGCPTTGRNIGAERMVTDDPKSTSAEKKAKFKGTKATTE